MKKLTEHISKSESILKVYSLKLTRNPADAKDLYQDTIFNILRNADSFQLGSSFKAWSARIMKNVFLNDYRKKSRRISILNRREYITYPSSPNAHTFNCGENNLSIAEINEMINSINLDFRLPFIKMYEGYTYEEIADELEVPIGTVKSRIFYARKKLKAMYNNVVNCGQKSELLILY